MGQCYGRPVRFPGLQKQNLKKVALITASDGFGKDGKEWLEKLAPQHQLTLVADESFNPKDTDVTAQLTKIAATNPDAIVCWTIGPAGAIVTKNAKRLNIKTPLFQCHGQPDPKYVELAGSATANKTSAVMLTCFASVVAYARAPLPPE